MICRKPYSVGLVTFGCGQCIPCRINRRRVWAWRIMLEALCHEHNAFVTLTYDEKHQPAAGVDRRELQLFFKRWRSYGARLRYFAVGEYGEETWRPHYHVAAFGADVRALSHLDRAWTAGFSHVGELNHATAAYIAGYVVKKLTSMGDERLDGRNPEFALMSRRPGIGAEAMAVVAAGIAGSGLRLGSTPGTLAMGRKEYPLGRFLRSKLRARLGVSDEEWRREVDQWSMAASEEVRSLYEASTDFVASPSSLVAARDIQRVRSVEARAKLFNARRSL